MDEGSSTFDVEGLIDWVRVLETNKKKENVRNILLSCSDYGNRTRVPCVRGMCPNP